VSLDKNIVIAALARDCDKSLISNIPRIEKLRREFAWSCVVVIENDSKDKTKEILNIWSRQSAGVEVISKDFGTITIPQKSGVIPSPTTSLCRIEKMVKYRNMYMDYIKTIEHTIDYLIIIDIDIEDFSVDGIVKSILNAKEDWGGIFANGITKKEFKGKVFSKIFHDVFAICEYPLTDKVSFNAKTLDIRKKTIQKQVNRNAYTSIISAFGGIGIYKYDVIKNLKYRVLQNYENGNEAVCEHIPFNIEIIKAGHKNYIARDLYVLYGDHLFGAILETKLHRKLFELIFSIYRKAKSHN